MWRFAVNIAKPIAIQEDLVVDPVSEPVVALVGPNGAGKSTLLRALAGFLGAQQGDLTGPPWQRPLVWVSQQPSLFPHRTIKEQIEWVLRGRLEQDDGMMEWAAALNALEFLKSKPHMLSGGQQQRAMLLRALAAQPQILALDEALSQIDPPSRESIADRLRQWAGQEPDRLLMITTHQFADVAHLAHRVLVMADGKLLRQGSPDDVVREPRSWAVAALVGYVARLRTDGADYALRSEDLGWRPPGILVPAEVAQVRGEETVVRLATQDGRSQFVVRGQKSGICVGDSVSVYLRGVVVAVKEGTA